MFETIKLVALDMDGTLLNSKKEIPPSFFPWVKQHPQVKTVIASGRQLWTLLDQFEEIKDHLIFAAENGLMLYEKGKVLNQDTLPKEKVRTLISYFSHHPELDFVLCGTKCAYILKGKAELERNTIPYYAHWQTIDSFDTVLDKDDFLKIALFYPLRNAKENYSLLKDCPYGKMVVSGAEWIDLSNPGRSKGTGIQKLQEIYHLKKEECMAFGDAMNDFDMLNRVGFSVAMANAMDEIKKICKLHTTSNDDDGVMRILSQF